MTRGFSSPLSFGLGGGFSPRTGSVGASGPAQLLDFDGAGAAFERNDGTPGSGGAAQYLTSATTFLDAVSDALRTETIGGVGMYLFEPQETNYATNSDGFASAWTLTSVTVTSDVVAGPGGILADRLDYTSGATARVGQTKTSGFPDGTVATCAYWVCGSVGGETVRIAVIDRAVGVNNSSDFTLTTSWQLISYTVSVGSGATNPVFRLIQGSAAAAKTIYATRAYHVASRHVSSQRATSLAATAIREADQLTIEADQVPLALRAGTWTISVRTKWAHGDLTTGDKRVICSTDSSNWIGFEYDAGSVYLRCYVGGALAFGTAALTIVRDTVYAVIVDMALGQMTFNGVAGSAAGATSLPGGVPLRWGGTAGGANELRASTTEPRSVA